MMRRLLLAFPLLLHAATLHAQEDALAEIERMAGTGRFTEARSSLERWNREHPASARVQGEVRARAALLAARLAVDADAAEAGYLEVALSWPASHFAAEALLRLGQGLVARAESGARDAAPRASAYLERLVSDYPGSPHRAPGLLWLVRAHTLAGRTERACSIARDALDVGIDDPEVDDVMRVEFATHCDGLAPRPQP